MNSCVIGTIELADQPIESLAPDNTSVATLPERIRHAIDPATDRGATADHLPFVDEVIDADLPEIRRQLRYELTQIMRACEILGRKG